MTATPPTAADSGPRLRADGRFWLTLDGRNFLGRGRVELLRHIATSGSIAQAAKTMHMSYKAAWDAVAAMNDAWGQALVESGPRGSRLSADAHRLIAAYETARAAHERCLDALAQNLPTRPNA